MKAIRKTQNRGLTMIEIMVATVIIIAAAISSMGFRYYSALDARKADTQMTASRLGLTLLESWKNSGAFCPSDPNRPATIWTPYSLVYPELDITTATGPAEPNGFTLFGGYSMVAGGMNYLVTLSHNDETTDRLRLLNVRIAWPGIYGKHSVVSLSNTSQSISLTTKARLPE